MDTTCAAADCLDSLPALRILPGGKAALMKDPPLEAALANDVDRHFESLVREYQDRLYSFALRLTRHREDSEEIVQDAFVRAYRALKSYSPARVLALAIRPWLYKIVLNVARNRLRRKQLRIESLDESRSRRLSENDPGPLERLEASQERADLASLVAALPSRYREPIILRYVEGLKLEEVAAILRQPLGTTKSNVHRAINALREAIIQSRRSASTSRRRTHA
jgi:RNA polymerase sigma-70 factor, ECF subfamily